MQLTLRDLQYFVALAEHRNFSKAANFCHVSQPTLSGQMQKFEQRLGFLLFERDRKKLMITPAGEVLLEQAREIINQANLFELQAQALQDPLSGAIHFGLIPTLGPYLLAICVKQLSQSLPNIEFYFHEHPTDLLLEQLNRGELDVLVLPYLDEMASFNCIPIFYENLILVTPHNHPLSHREDLQLDDLRGEKILTLQDGHCLSEQTRSYCFTAGAKEDKRFRASSLETLRYQVAGGHGITLFPELACENDADQLISYRRFIQPEPNRQIVAVTRLGYPRMQAVRELVKTLRHAYQNRRINSPVI